MPPTGVASPAYAGDPCPAVLAAFRRAVADVPFPIARISAVPGPFECGYLWPGIGTPPVCFMPLMIPGRDMHGWVGFGGTDEVAAVAASRPMVPSDATPPPAPLPWTARVIALQVPPPGWTIPQGSGQTYR